MISTSVEPELLEASTIDSTCSGEVIVHREVGFASSQRDAVVMSTRSVLEVRATMVWSLATSVQIWLTGARPFLTHDERSESCALLRLHLISYQWLAARAVQRGILNWRIRPKYHYAEHMREWVNATGVNPMAQSCFLDEDNMKALAKIAAAVHPGTFNVEFARRYALKRVLSFAEHRQAEQIKRVRRV